jgi:O-succinylbenzoate synthase
VGVVRFEFRPYHRAFRHPLQTSHGLWTVREGIIIRLSDSAGRVGFGEIAPLEWFGSETFEAAIALCRSLPLDIDQAIISAIPDHLPACQFGFESALLSLSSTLEEGSQLPQSALLPAGEKACQAWEDLWKQGYRTFKWKIGINEIDHELETLKQLVKSLPDTATLRLDANAGLTLAEAQQWLDQCDLYSIEFLEQPLPVNQFESLLMLSQQYSTPIALDESVATLHQLKTCYEQGWRGIFVIKPAIVGFPSRLRHFCQHHPIDAVFSSGLETAIGRQVGLTLAAELSDKLSNNHRAVGYGTTHWFEELMTEDFEELWQSL